MIKPSIIFIVILALANSTVHSYQNFYSACQKDASGQTCSQGWCYNQRTVNQDKTTHSICTTKPFNLNENWRIVYDNCQVDSSGKNCDSKCCQIMFMGYDQQKPVRAFCCSDYLATWCSAEESLAIKTDAIQKSKIKKKTQTQTGQKSLKQLGSILWKTARDYLAPSN